MLELLGTPEVIRNGGMTINITHRLTRYVYDDREGATVSQVKGYLDASGAFIDYGPFDVQTFAPAELPALGPKVTLDALTAAFQTKQALISSPISLAGSPANPEVLN